MDPATLKFAKTHEWVGVDGDIAAVGITDFAVQQLTDLVYVDLPQPGTELAKGETFGEIESVKAVSDLYAPLTGKVVQVNDALPDDLAILSDDPFGRGWMVRVELTSPDDLDELMSADEYSTFCNEQEH